jgi:hypothetical protein
MFVSLQLLPSVFHVAAVLVAAALCFEVSLLLVCSVLIVHRAPMYFVCLSSTAESSTSIALRCASCGISACAANIKVLTS